MNSLVEYKYVIEGESTPLHTLKQYIQNSSAIFQFLIENSYIQPGTQGSFFFNFVGVIALEKLIICCLPKYYSGQNLSDGVLLSNFVDIVKALKRIGYSQNIPDLGAQSSRDKLLTSELPIADKLLQDYLENGVFYKKRTEVFNGLEGEANWEMTIHLIHPICSKKGPVYYDLMCESISSEEHNLITEFHKWCIKYALTRYGRLLDYNFTFNENCVDDFTELCSIEYLQNVIRKELNDTYSDREILLLRRLLSFTSNAFQADSNHFSIYGTKYFHIVWEVVCAATFLNRITEFQDTIPLPIWRDTANRAVPKETIKPDIISVYETADDGLFFIFDAKYYNLSYNYVPYFNVSGQPGVSDISKQFLYNAAFQKVKCSKHYNCFLFPKLSEDFYELSGDVIFDLFPDTKIHCLYLSATKVIYNYLTNTQEGYDSLLNISEEIDGSQ